MENILIALRITQQENQALHKSTARLQNNWVLTSLGCVFYNVTPSKGTTNQPIWQVQWDMFKVLNFVNQVHLIIDFHLHCYPNGPTQVEFLHILLPSTTLIWFTPLLMNSMSSLERQTKKHTSSKLKSLCQGSHLNVVYTSKFK